MEGHLTAWRVHRLLAFFYGLAFVGLVAFDFLKPGVFRPLQLYGLASALPLLALFHALAARGARLRQPWARIASLVMGCILLVAFPIGTIAGIFLVFACAHPWPDPREHAAAARGAWHGDTWRR
jgi:hypothetical protein